MIGWTGTVFGILGAMLVASNSGVNDIGYIFFTIGSMSSLIDSFQQGNKSAVTLWLVFFIINIFGLVSYLK